MQMNMTSTVDLSLDWESAFGSSSEHDVAHADSISDALILSLSNLGRVDIGYIMDATGEDYTTVVDALRGAIFQNPDRWGEDPYKGWETAEEYLSGNLRRKLRCARKANNLFPGRFKDNVYAIRKLIPESVDTKDIYITIGSPWVPVDVIENFIVYLLKINTRTVLSVKHDEYTSSWEISNKGFFAALYSMAATNLYGTPKMDALEIIERTLNMKTIAVYDEVSSSLTKSGKKRVINQGETLLALEKQQIIISKFKKWVWADAKRKELLENIFETKYSCVRRRIFDGSFLKFPGMSDKIQLYPYQKNAIARIIFSPNTLLAHEVGSGKTYVMIAAGMELLRMGLSKKNLYVVPNNIVTQWRDFFERMYPGVNVLCVEAKNFTPQKREGTLSEVRDGKWDAIIMSYSCFDRIPLSKSAIVQQLQDKVDQIDQIEKNVKKITSGLKRKKDLLNKEIYALREMLEEDSICFDDLGITRMFVDEAHNYKNVPIETKIDKVLGISAAGSKKCKDMMDKVYFIQKQNNGGGVVMATGTPITNSLTDAYIMQKYLQSGELAMLDIQTFDSWIGMFAEKVTEFEVDVDTNNYRLATRFAKFHNLTELTALLSSIADFHQANGSVDLPNFEGYNDSLIERTKAFEAYLKKISSRAESVRSGFVDCRVDNMLKITTDGRKAALDLRLVDDNATLTYKSKVFRCAENVFEIYEKTEGDKSTQLIFCDSSTPKEGFNIYSELKRILVFMGVREEDIAFVHDASSEAQRSKLFAKVRSGEIRVLVGSTFKLGMGVNVQDKLVALHHLDVPWRPADMIQREGRILRQGNSNERVYIYRYITEGSFDAYSWQLLETKQRFISELLSGSLSERSGSDVESTVLNYAEVKALAIGNPLIKQRVEISNELARIFALNRKEVENRIKLEKELLEMPASIARQRELTEKCLEDVRSYRASRCDYDKEERRVLRNMLSDAINEHIKKERDCEVEVMTYQGFKVVLPANMTREKAYLWIRREGNYFVELGESAQGAIMRIDNCLSKLSERYQKMSDALRLLVQKQEMLREELSKNKGYADRIEALKHELENLDKKLGVVNI